MFDQGLINEELRHIPRGDRGSAQNTLRALYQMARASDLAGPNRGKEAVLMEAIRTVSEKNPGFRPEFDQGFFKAQD